MSAGSLGSIGHAALQKKDEFRQAAAEQQAASEQALAVQQAASERALAEQKVANEQQRAEEKLAFESQTKRLVELRKQEAALIEERKKAGNADISMFISQYGQMYAIHNGLPDPDSSGISSYEQQQSLGPADYVNVMRQFLPM